MLGLEILNQQNGKEEERITDGNFRVISLKIEKYHWEYQSSADSSLLVRFFEYDAQIALDEGELKENILTVTFPHSAVLFLRCDKNTPNKVLEHLAKNYENVKKGAKSVMGGKVLDYEAKTIRNEGIEQGLICAASMLQKLGYSDTGIVNQITDNYKMSEK